MSERSHEGGDGSSHKNPHDQAEQPEHRSSEARRHDSGGESKSDQKDTNREQGTSSRWLRDSKAAALDEAVTFKRLDQSNSGRLPPGSSSQGTDKSAFSPLREFLQGDRNQAPKTFLRFGSGSDKGSSPPMEPGNQFEKKTYDNPFRREPRPEMQDVPQSENAAIWPTEGSTNLERKHETTAEDAAVHSRAQTSDNTFTPAVGSPLAAGDHAADAMSRSATARPDSPQGPADRGTFGDHGTNADDRRDAPSATVRDAVNETQRWAIELNDDELIGAIIDRDEILAGQSNPVALTERDILRAEQSTRELIRQAEQAQTPAERTRNWAEMASDTELGMAIERTAAEHDLAPSSNTEADLSVLEAVRDARIGARAQQASDALIRVQEPPDGGSPSSGHDARTATQADERSRSDDAVEAVNRVREQIDQVEKWAERGEILLTGRAGEWMGRIHDETKKWNAVISKVDRLKDAEMLYDASVSFAKLTKVNPENSKELATTAGAAFADFGRLLEKTKIPIVSDYGKLLKSTRHLFERMSVQLDPIQRLEERHPDIIKEIGFHSED